jgi:vitamin B12 transporter
MGNTGPVFFALRKPANLPGSRVFLFPAEGVGFTSIRRWSMKRLCPLAFYLLVCAAPSVYALDVTPSPSPSPSPTSTATSATVSGFLLDEVVVTSDRLPTPKDQVAGSISVLTASDLERQQQTTVANALREIPGVDVVQEGGDGKVTSISLRGAGSDRTLVFVDGVEVNDPIGDGGSGSFDFANLTTDNVERIEVLRGSQSALYGPDATGGVLQIFTKKGQGPLNGSLSGELGSMGYLRSALALNGGDHWLDYSMQVSHLTEKGFSSAAFNPSYVLPLEDNGTQNSVVSSQFESSPVSFLTLSLVQRYTDSKTSVDDGPLDDDPNHFNLTRESILKGGAETTFWDGRWNQTFSFSQALEHFSDLNDPDLDHPFDSLRDFFNGRRQQFDWQSNLRLIPRHTFSFGFENRQEWGDTSGYSVSAWGPYPFETLFLRDRTNGWFLQDQASYFDRLFVSSGVRWDQNDVFGGRATWRLAPAFILPFTQTKLKSTLGTGWKTPTLYQQSYDSADPTLLSLLPEKSLSWDFGFEQPFLKDKIHLDAVCFLNQYKNFLDWDNTANDDYGAFVNVSRVRMRGTETSLEGHFYKDGLAKISINYTEAENLDTLELLPGHPSHRASFSLDSPSIGGARAGFEVLYTGRRDDLLWPDVLVPLPDYTLVRLHVDWKPSQRITLFGRVENLFNRRYQEVYGYQTAPRAVYAGTTLHL